MKTAKSVLAILTLGLAILLLDGCVDRPIRPDIYYAFGDELDPGNKTIATDPRNKMAAH
jgi:hypothetical protein